MQKQVKAFIDDLKKEVSESRFSKNIVSIVLLGSAARSEWIKGESDIDMIIIVKNNRMKRSVNDFFTNLFRRLNKKHKMKLEETCTTEQKSKHAVLNVIFKIDSFVFVGVPFHVYING